MPQREGARGARPRMLPAGGPGGPVIPPRSESAEAAWTDGTWRPVTVRGWFRPEGGERTIMSARVFEWIVLLDFETAPDFSGWYCYEAAALRPAGSN